MKQNAKRITAMLSAGVLMTSFALTTFTVNASEFTLTEPTSSTANVPSEFTVTDNMIVDGAVVKIPASLNPVYNEAFDTFYVSDVVSVYGEIASTNQVVVSISKEHTYTLKDSEETLTGFASFGAEHEGTCTNTWNSTQVAKGAADSSLADSRSVIINVPTNALKEIGDYETDVEFDIKLGYLGLYNEICAPTTISSANPVVIKERDSSSPDVSALSYEFGNFNMSSMNLTNMQPDVKAAFLSLERSNSTLTYLELSDNANIMYPGCINGTTDYTKCYGWLGGNPYIQSMKKLKVLVIPGTFTSANFPTVKALNKSVGYWSDSDYIDGTNLTFDNSTTVIGNAICFAKDSENGRYVYVPHIVYRGTMEQWRALSGHDDWVFGNAANLVTVHCYDGEIVY